MHGKCSTRSRQTPIIKSAPTSEAFFCRAYLRISKHGHSLCEIIYSLHASGSLQTSVSLNEEGTADSCGSPARPSSCKSSFLTRSFQTVRRDSLSFLARKQGYRWQPKMAGCCRSGNYLHPSNSKSSKITCQEIKSTTKWWITSRSLVPSASPLGTEQG